MLGTSMKSPPPPHPQMYDAIRTLFPKTLQRYLKCYFATDL